jgi:hypothetical protein
MNTGPVHDRVTVNSLRFSRLPDAPDSALRYFDAEVALLDEVSGGSVVIGTIRGWLGWESWLPELVDNGQPVGGIAQTMAAAAIEVGEELTRLHGAGIEAVLMIDHLGLLPQWLGSGLGPRIVEQVIDLLLLTPEVTLVLTHLDGPPSAYISAGFEQWRDSVVWWARMGEVTQRFQAVWPAAAGGTGGATIQPGGTMTDVTDPYRPDDEEDSDFYTQTVKAPGVESGERNGLGDENTQTTPPVPEPAQGDPLEHGLGTAGDGSTLEATVEEGTTFGLGSDNTQDTPPVPEPDEPDPLRHGLGQADDTVE